MSDLSASAWPPRRWYLGWSIAIGLLMVPMLGAVIIFLVWHVALIPVYFVLKSLAFLPPVWPTVIVTWGLIAFGLSLAVHWSKGRRPAFIRAACAVTATVAFFEVAAIHLCRINERARADAARTCHPHVAGWLATEHLRRPLTPKASPP